MRRVALVVVMMLLMVMAGTMGSSRAANCSSPTNPPPEADTCCPGGWVFEGCETESGTDQVYEVYSCSNSPALCESMIRRPLF